MQNDLDETNLILEVDTVEKTICSLYVDLKQFFVKKSTFKNFNFFLNYISFYFFKIPFFLTLRSSKTCVT